MKHLRKVISYGGNKFTNLRYRFWLALCVFCAMPIASRAQPPDSVTLQGRLSPPSAITGATARVLRDGATVQTLAVNLVPDASGVFVTALTGLDPNIFAMGTNFEVTLSSPTGEALGTIPIRSVPFAFQTRSSVSPTDTTITADADGDGTGSILLRTGTTDRLTILNNGNVGVGTSVPVSTLTVVGGLSVGTALASPAFSVDALDGAIGLGGPHSGTPGDFRHIDIRGKAIAPGFAKVALIGVPFGDSRLSFLSLPGEDFSSIGIHTPDGGINLETRSTLFGGGAQLSMSYRDPNGFFFAGMEMIADPIGLNRILFPSGSSLLLAPRHLNPLAESLVLTPRGPTGSEMLRVGIRELHPQATLHVNGNFMASGTKSSIMDDPENPDAQVAFYSIEGPKVKFFEDGEVALTNGSSSVSFSREFSLLISTVSLPLVQLTPLGECGGLMVVSRTQNGFAVRELQGGKSNIRFMWLATAVRSGFDAGPIGKVKPKPKDIPFSESFEDTKRKLLKDIPPGRRKALEKKFFPLGDTR